MHACMHPCRPEEANRIAAMAARVEAMERALAAREAQMAHDCPAVTRRRASCSERGAAEDRHALCELRQVAGLSHALAAPRLPAALQFPECAADWRGTAPDRTVQPPARQCVWLGPQPAAKSPGAAEFRQKRLPARMPASGRSSSEATRAEAARASSEARSPRSMAGRRQREARHCGKATCSYVATADAPTQLPCRQAGPARASREFTAASRPDTHAGLLQQPSGYSNGDESDSWASIDQEERRPIMAATAVTLQREAHDEPRPRALPPAPMRPRATSASSRQQSQSDTAAQTLILDRHQHEPGDAVRSNDRPSHRGLHARSGARGSSDHGPSASWPQPAEAAADVASRQGSLGGATSAERVAHAGSLRNGECAHPGDSDDGRTAGDAAAVRAENTDLREALRCNGQALAVAQEAAQRINARRDSQAAQLADAQLAAQADAERADARTQQLEEELARCATISPKSG